MKERNVECKTVDSVYFLQKEGEHHRQMFVASQGDCMDIDGHGAHDYLPDVTVLIYAVPTASSGTNESLAAAKHIRNYFLLVWLAMVNIDVRDARGFRQV